jgi:predicted PurR-regulated permease PerM
MTPQGKTTLIRFAAGLAFLIAVTWLMLILESITTMVLVAFFLAYILNPLVERLDKMGLGRPVAAMIILLLGISSFVGLLMVVIPAILEELASFAHMLPAYLTKLGDLSLRLAETLNIQFPQDSNEITTFLIQQGRELIPKTAQTVTQVMSSVFKSTLHLVAALLQTILVPVIAYYLMVSFTDIKKGFTELIPPYLRIQVLEKFAEIDQILAGFVRGQLTIAVILACLYTLGFLLIRIDLAVVLGVVSGILFIVPYVGTLFGLVFGSLMALAKYGDAVHVAYVIGWIAFVQTIEGYLLTPRIVGHAVGLHPVIYILALLIGAHLFGFVGMLVAIPVAAVLKVLVKTAVEAYQNSYLYNDVPGQNS